MRNILDYRTVLGLALCLLCSSLSAQLASVYSDKNQFLEENYKRLENFQELKSLGYTEKEIYEDLGNANFLSKKYETALFWYGKLIELSQNGTLERNYQKRYDYALSKIDGSRESAQEEDENWTELILEDYQMTKAAPYREKRVSFRDTFRPLKFQTAGDGLSLGVQEPFDTDPTAKMNYNAPVVVTKDGNTAYFSKATYVKPVTGIFSKKELVHRIYKADKVNGEWKTIRELPLCPNGFSALHPTVSVDGKRLFFASNMPGTFGEYDIYVSNIGRNGSIGIAKNLGEKVNTKKNDMYPKIMENNTLVFASEGHKGYGGLDVFMVQIEQRKVGLAINLGSPVNSVRDDFSIHFEKQNGMGYVVSNRGKKGNNAQKIAFSYLGHSDGAIEKDYHLLEAANNGRINYSSNMFEDE
ncbi:cell envelope biogenesis protein OmpA [Maribacter sp. 2304DJ31-5]|uniref:cell envelope biogenesis protein OmpA n=1 Tax=Maribacter sp. 2304DJ31-5 TaxID=3386273 RepID=UPI0039BCC661